jgi:hypothetical protein
MPGGEKEVINRKKVDICPPTDVDAEFTLNRSSNL